MWIKNNFKIKYRLNTLFHFKDLLGKKIRSGIIYHYSWVTATLLNTEKTLTLLHRQYRHFYTRAAERLGISNLTGKCLKYIKQSAISEHLLQCNCAINFDKFDILAAESNKFKLPLSDSLLIKRDEPILIRTIKSFPLELFA